MDRSLFKFILRYGAKDQVILVLLSAIGLPFLYFTFDLPKTIVNKALGGKEAFPISLFGLQLDQLPYLWTLCGIFLALVLVNGAMKYVTSTYRYRVGDRLLRRLRFELIERLMRFPQAEFRNSSSGQIVSMITAETSPLGFFIAEAFAVPAVAAGTLGTIVLFMFLQDWMMGIAAIALFPAQIYFIPRIQKQVNGLARQEVQVIRKIADRIGEVVAAAPEIHGHDTSQYELADFSERLGAIFKLRVEIASKRYIANVLNAFFSQLTPFFFLAIGGYLVIQGDLTLGSLVAVLAAYKDMYAPWKDLIDYYQKAEDARVKYAQLAEYFSPSGLLARELLHAEPQPFDGMQIVATNVVVQAEDGAKQVDGASLNLPLPIHASVVGPAASGRDDFARLLARQVFPNAGRVQFGEHDLSTLPDSVIGRRIAYVSADTNLGSGTVRDILVYPLLHRPHAIAEVNPARQIELAEAARAGNSAHDIAANWVDYAAAGCTDQTDLLDRIVKVLRDVDLERDIFDIGLKRTIDPVQSPDLAKRLIEARGLFRRQLESAGSTGLVETFDPQRYNTNASVAENILFGTPVGPAFAVEQLGETAYMQQVIAKAGLTREFLEKGRRLATIMSDIFRDLSAGHEFIERFSFIRAEELPLFEAILRRAESVDLEALDAADRQKLMALPFKLVVTTHHTGLIDADFQKKILEARRVFAASLPAELYGAVQFFNPVTYNAASNILENVVMGKLVAAKAGGAGRVGGLVADVIEALGLRKMVIELGLSYDTGIGAARLNPAQRQKLALARCLLKRPDVLLISDALSALDGAARAVVMANVKAEMDGRSLLVFEEAGAPPNAERVLHMENGKIVDRAAKSARDASAAEPTESLKADNANLNDLSAVLVKIPMFAAMDRSTLKLLAFTSALVTYDEGQEVFHQGEPGDKAYVVIDGEVEVLLESDAGSKVVARLGRNQMFGEMALLSNIPRTTSIRAARASTLLVIGHDVFLRLVEDHSEISGGVMRLLTQRLASTLKDYSAVTISIDPVTSLPTSQLFADSCKRALAQEKRFGRQPWLLGLDLAQFIAEGMRLAPGEPNMRSVILREIADRLRECVRDDEELGHLKGNELAVLFIAPDEATARLAARKLTNRMAKTLSAPFTIGAVTVPIGASARFAVSRLTADDPVAALEEVRKASA